jgi:hypothetical protein
VAVLERELQASAGRVRELDSTVAPLKQAAAECRAAQEALQAMRAQDYARRLAGAVEERELWRDRAGVLAEELERAVAADGEQRRAAEKMVETVNYLKCEVGRVARAWKEAQGEKQKEHIQFVLNR